MGYSKRRKLFMVMAAALFIILGMLNYSSHSDYQVKRSAIAEHTTWISSKGSMALTQEREIISTANVSVPVKNVTTAKPVPAFTSLMEKRRKRVASVCTNMTSQQSPSVKDVLYNDRYKFYYCPVEKIASTFWRRFSYQLSHTNPVKSPFDVPIMTALRGVNTLHLPTNMQSGKELDKVLESSTKILWTRDPYTRIFSAYIDKLLAPNPYYWKVWGLPATMRYRPHHHDNKLRGHAHCGHDVTFEEFLKFVLNSASLNDGHVMPINTLCTPCAVSYTVIGKMDSFVDDSKLLFDILHLNQKNLRFDTMRRETTLDAIQDSATDALSVSWLSSSLKCITKEAVLKKIWRKSQIRGFISWRRNLNLAPEQILNMKSNEFIKLMKQANSLSTNKSELSLQKRQAMMEAFRSLDNNLFKDIVRIYKDDMKLFDYDDYPPWFEQIKDSSFINTNSLDFSRDWDLGVLLKSKA